MFSKPNLRPPYLHTTVLHHTAFQSLSAAPHKICHNPLSEVEAKKKTSGTSHLTIVSLHSLSSRATSDPLFKTLLYFQYCSCPHKWLPANTPETDKSSPKLVKVWHQKHDHRHTDVDVFTTNNMSSQRKQEIPIRLKQWKNLMCVFFFSKTIYDWQLIWLLNGCEQLCVHRLALMSLFI